MESSTLLIGQDKSAPPSGCISAQVCCLNDGQEMRSSTSLDELSIQGRKKRLMKPGEVFQMGLVLSKPHCSIFAVRKNTAHNCNLKRAFVYIVLVDADCIRPENDQYIQLQKAVLNPPIDSARSSVVPFRSQSSKRELVWRPHILLYIPRY